MPIAVTGGVFFPAYSVLSSRCTPEIVNIFNGLSGGESPRRLRFFSSPFLWMQKKKTATQTFSFSVRMRPELDAGVQLHWRWKSS